MTAASARDATAEVLAWLDDPKVWRGELEVWNETYYVERYGAPEDVVDVELGHGAFPSGYYVEAACPVCRPGAVADGALEGGPVSAPATYLETRRIAKSLGFAITLLVGAGTLAGCAGPVTHVPAPSAQSVSEMRAAYRTFDVARKERQVPRGWKPAIEAVERVRQRVMPAAQRVCERSFSDGCARAIASLKVKVHADDDTVNAYAAMDGTLGFYGGFVRSTGNDDELAAVMAHEIAHVLYGHNQATAANTNLGALAGLAAGLAIMAGTGVYNQGMQDMTQSFGQAGAEAGRVAYSPEMELEADHFAVFVLREAGYDPDKGGMTFLRMARTLQGDRAAGRRSFVSYFSTHPADDYRLAVWREGVAAARRGQDAPLTQEQAEQIAERERVARERQAQAHASKMAWAEYKSPQCEAVRRAYPDCGFFHEGVESAMFIGRDCPQKALAPAFFGMIPRSVVDRSCACPQTEGLLGFPVPVERCVVPEGY